VANYRAVYMLGRCANGAQRDTGRKVHAKPDGQWRALCGAEPGSQSAGWTENDQPAVTCPRCLAKLKRQVDRHNQNALEARDRQLMDGGRDA
jgi:hypothetical protein